MSSRLAVPILALVAVPVIAAAALLAAFAHEFVSEDVAPSPGRVIEGSVWIVTGLIAWWRVPGNRIGPLATAFGFVDIASLLYWDAALPFSLAPIVGAFIFAIGVHLFLAFPTGRLQTRTDRAVVAFAYVATVILAPAGAMFRETLPGCADCPTNLLFVADIPALAAAIDVAATLMVVGLLLVTIALVIRHWRGASPESRLALDPVLGVSGLATVSLLATVVAQGLGLDGAVAALDAVGGTLFVLIPIAFLAGLLRLRLHRAREADLEVERLQAQLRAQLVEVRASRARIVEAGDAERSRVERDLHDGAQQRLLGVRMALRTARNRLADGQHRRRRRAPDGSRRRGDGRAWRAARSRPRHPPGRADRGRDSSRRWRPSPGGRRSRSTSTCAQDGSRRRSRRPRISSRQSPWPTSSSTPTRRGLACRSTSDDGARAGSGRRRWARRRGPRRRRAARPARPGRGGRWPLLRRVAAGGGTRVSASIPCA